MEDHGDLVFFVMAFVDGETVRQSVQRRGPLPIGEVLRMLQEVAWALDYAHGRGVVHRDIKPDNILLEAGSGRAVVTDFGIARAGPSSTLTAAGSLLGTPEFASPEQALGEEVDGRSDLYSLGVTCFFALTGCLPFEATNVQGMLAKHLREAPPSVTVLRPEVPRRLAGPIDQCLEKDPEDRFGTAGQLAEAVSEARAQVVDVPAALQEVRKAAELLVVDGVGFGAFSAMVGLELLWPNPNVDPFGFGNAVDAGLALAVWILSIGLVGSRAVQVIRRSRAAIAQGFSVQHLGNAFRERIPETDSRIGINLLGHLPAGLEASALLASLLLIDLGWIFLWNAQDANLGVFLGLAAGAMLMSLFVLPVLVGRTFGARMIRRWPATRRAWARLWQGRIGRWVFRVGGIGLRKNRQAPPAAHPTEVLVAAAAADLFDSLPPEYQARLEGVQELVTRLQAAAHYLRGRGAELEGARASVGTVGSPVDRRLSGEPKAIGVADSESVHAHRVRAAEDLDSARRIVGARLSETVAALENLRLGLLRLQAGVGSPDELTADLRVAREVGKRVQSLLDGERQVEDFLEKAHPTGMSPLGSHSRSEEELV